jgi:hypothetical protein
VEFGGQVHDWLVRTGRGNNDGFGRESVSQGSENLWRGGERNTQPMKKEILLCVGEAFQFFIHFNCKRDKF